VVVEFQCNFTSAEASLAVCSDPNNVVIRQYQFECIRQVWSSNIFVHRSISLVQTLNPTATLSTLLVDTCLRCIDDHDQQSGSGTDPVTHCDRESSID
jgi:hypothetical protein